MQSAVQSRSLGAAVPAPGPDDAPRSKRITLQGTDSLPQMRYGPTTGTGTPFLPIDLRRSWMTRSKESTISGIGHARDLTAQDVMG